MARIGAPAYLRSMRETRAMKEARLSAMTNRAYELARSGAHGNYISIEQVLMAEFGNDRDPRPHAVFASPWQKTHFDQVCEAAYREKSNAQGS